MKFRSPLLQTVSSGVGEEVKNAELEEEEEEQSDN